MPPAQLIPHSLHALRKPPLNAAQVSDSQSRVWLRLNAELEKPRTAAVRTWHVWAAVAAMTAFAYVLFRFN